ncbi:MAG: EscU/YscU/HrcU family type III secretion system export apparatus switch protein [Planctomycetota bacterium]
MADDSDRVIPATPRRREAARREGLMPTAALPAWMATVATTVILVPIWATTTLEAATAVVREAIAAAGRGSSGGVPPASSFIGVALPTIAVVLAAAGVGLAVRLAVDGFSWQPGRVVPVYRRIDPVAGLARVLSFRTLASACGAGLGLVAIATAAVFVIRPPLAGGDPTAALAAAWRGVAWLLVAAALVAVVSWLSARRRFEQRIRMTPEEFADEARSPQADPKVRLLQQHGRRQPTAGAA